MLSEYLDNDVAVLAPYNTYDDILVAGWGKLGGGGVNVLYHICQKGEKQRHKPPVGAGTGAGKGIRIQRGSSTDGSRRMR